MTKTKSTSSSWHLIIKKFYSLVFKMSLQFRSKLFEINFYKCCPINLSHSSTVLKFSLEQNILHRKLLVSIFLFPINHEQFLLAKYNLCSSFPFFYSCLKIEIRLRLLQGKPQVFLFTSEFSNYLQYKMALFSFFLLFTQFRSCDNTLESCLLLLLLFPDIHVDIQAQLTKDTAENFLEN